MNDDAQKKLLIHDINRKLERLAQHFGDDYTRQLFQKIEAKIGTANIYWKYYPGKTKHTIHGEIKTIPPYRVLGISQSKQTLQVVYTAALKDIRQSIPTVTQVRSEHYEDYIDEQTDSGFDGSIDEFVRFIGEIDQRIKRFLHESDYRDGDGYFWNAMPRNRDGSIVSYTRISQELQKYGF